MDSVPNRERSEQMLAAGRRAWENGYDLAFFFPFCKLA